MPEYVHMFTNEETKQMAITPAKPDADAITFYKKPADGKHLLLRWTNKKLAQEMMDIAGITGEKISLRIPEKYYPEENVLIYNLAEQMPAAVKKRG